MRHILSTVFCQISLSIALLNNISYGQAGYTDSLWTSSIQIFDQALIELLKNCTVPEWNGEYHVNFQDGAKFYFNTEDSEGSCQKMVTETFGNKHINWELIISSIKTEDKVLNINLKSIDYPKDSKLYISLSTKLKSEDVTGLNPGQKVIVRGRLGVTSITNPLNGFRLLYGLGFAKGERIALVPIEDATVTPK